MNYIGDFAEDSTVRIVLTTNNSSGGAVAPSSAFEADDFRIYKNGSATQKTTTNGITIASPFDSVTGLHTLTIDTSNDTGDSGFWTTGADYWVVAVPDETVDSQTVVQPIAAFSIQNRYMRGTDGANTTTPPTAAANATAVRSELATELGRIDVATSTRLASASYSAPPNAGTIADALWDEPLVDHTSTGSFGAGVSYIITTVAAILVAVNTLTSRISSGVATMFADLIQMITGSGTANARFTAKALEQAPTGDVTVNITPAYVSQQAIVDNNKITVRRGSRGWVLLTVTDATTGDPIDLSVYAELKFLVGPAGEATVQTQDVTAFGADNNQFYWKPNEASTLKERQLNWSLFNDIDDTASQYYRAKPADGVINVLESPV